MTKPGPKPKEGPRERNGRHKRNNYPVPAYEGPTEEMVQRRAEVVPFSLAKSQDAGKALGILYCRQDITWAQMQAGERLRQSWIKWRSLQGVPPRNQTTRGKASAHDPEWDDIDKAKSEYEERLSICLASNRHSELTRAILDELCMSDSVPPRVYEIGTVPDRIRECIRLSLGALAKYLKIEDRA